MLCLLRGELFQLQKQLSGDLGGGSILVEKLLGRNAEKFTYIKKSCERGKRPPVFDFVDVAFALRSIKDTDEGKKLVKEALNPFGVAIGASKVLKNLQQPTVYAQFVYNVDPYKGYTDGRQNLNMNGYMLDNYGACDGAASFRVGMSWNIQ